MPTTLSSLLIFVALLTPGFVYLVRTETKLSGQEHTALRETGVVVSVSLVANVFAVGLLLILRALAPDNTPDLEAFITDPGGYFDKHVLEVTVWTGCLTLLAVGLAAFVAVPPAWSDRIPIQWVQNEVGRRRRSSIAQESGWVNAFHRYPERRVHLGLTLLDETYLFGPLVKFNTQLDETSDRSLQLGNPIRIRTPKGNELTPLVADVVIVSAGQIKMMTIHYLPVD